MSTSANLITIIFTNLYRSVNCLPASDSYKISIFYVQKSICVTVCLVVFSDTP